MRNLSAIVFVCLLAIGSAWAVAPHDHPVQAELLADADGIVPGQEVTLGILLRMDEGWHTYWQGVGDAGKPTEVEWHLPVGWTVGPLRWPAPEKYVEEGGLIAYGYADEVLLLATATPPASLEQGTTAEIGASLSWLVCRELCIPGSAEVELRLPVGRGQAANEELFAAYAARVPPTLRQAGDLQVQIRTEDVVDGLEVWLRLDGGTARLEAGAGYPDFYPLELGDLALVESVADGPQGLRLRFERYGEAVPQRLRGLLVFGLDGTSGKQYRYVDLPLGPEEAAVASEGLWTYLWLAVVGGLLLNLMPCVLPVISLKIMGLVSQAGASATRVRLLGLAFCGGILFTFVALAAVVVLLKAAGHEIGWGFQFQQPAFVLGMAALVFVLGLSLFGVFEFRLPGMRGDIGQGEGLWNSAFNGVLATILATPCTAPFLGTALGFAFAQPAPTVVGVFSAVGFGMALPYGILALRPGWVEWLPRPGAWMLRFKQGMGFLLMATVLWLLWVLGKQLGVEALVWAAAFLLCLAVACWLVGGWLDLGSGRTRRLWVWGTALGIAAGGYWLLARPLLEAQPTAKSPADDEWIAFTPARLQALLDDNRLVFVDFTAEWCWTCKVNERTVLARPEVRQRLAAVDAAMVKADWTHNDPDITRMLRSFGRSGVPLYVIYPPGLPHQPLVLPEVITPGMVLEKIAAAEALGRRGN